MPKPTLQQRDNFKSYLRYNKNKFTSNLQKIPFFYVDDIMSQKSSGISTTTDVNVVIFNNNEFIGVTTVFNNHELIYIPAFPGESITLGIGTVSYKLEFIGDDQGLKYNGTTYQLNDQFIVGNKILTIKGLGGAMIQGGDPPTYSVTPNTTTINEGGNVHFTVNTTNVGGGTTLFYSTSGTAIANDFADNSLTGTFNIIGTGTTTGVATVTRTIAGDWSTTEGTETFNFIVRTGSVSGTAVTTSSTVSITDTVPTVSVTPSPTTVDEGGTLTVTVNTTGISSGTTLYYTLDGIGIAPADFTDNATSGSFVIDSSETGSFTKTLVTDLTTESTETFKVNIRSGSTSGTIVAGSVDIAISDTSKVPGETASGLTFGPVQVNRDGGNTANASDWYTICGIDNLPDGSKIALFIDVSGSMTQSTIQASYDLLLTKLNAKGITIISVTNSNEDWITPFLTTLA